MERKWEYQHRAFRRLDTAVDQELTELGADGWEVVNFVLMHDPADQPQYVYLLKRPADVEAERP